MTRWRIEEDHQLAKQSTGLDAEQVIRWKSWHRWTAICLLAYIYLTVAAAVQRKHEAAQDLAAGLIPITVPELCGCCATPSSHRRAGLVPPAALVNMGAATSTAPAKPTNAGTPMPRQHHDRNELQPP